MSKFVDRLGRVGQPGASPMGFGAASRRDEAVPAMMLLGTVTAEELSGDPELAEVEVDALLVSVGPWQQGVLENVAGALEGRLWGLRVEDVREEQIGDIKEAGCDFVVFQPEGTAAALLNDDDLGKVIALAGSLDRDLGRAIGELNIDAALYTPDGGLFPITVGGLIALQRVRGPVPQPFILATPPDPSPAELTALQDAGVSALSVDASAGDAIAATRKAIGNLPARRRDDSPGTAIVPSIHAEEFESPDHDDEDDF